MGVYLGHSTGKTFTGDDFYLSGITKTNPVYEFLETIKMDMQKSNKKARERPFIGLFGLICTKIPKSLIFRKIASGHVCLSSDWKVMDNFFRKFFQFKPKRDKFKDAGLIKPENYKVMKNLGMIRKSGKYRRICKKALGVTFLLIIIAQPAFGKRNKNYK